MVKNFKKNAIWRLLRIKQAYFDFIQLFVLSLNLGILSDSEEKNACSLGLLHTGKTGPRTLWRPKTLWRPRTLEGPKALWGPRTLWGTRALEGARPLWGPRTYEDLQPYENPGPYDDPGLYEDPRTYKDQDPLMTQERPRNV